MLRTALSMSLMLSWCAVTHSGTTEAPADAYAYIISPRHGEVVSSPVKVVFGLAGMGVAPAGGERDGTGHHHLLIDIELPRTDFPVPNDANHKHFGAGQTQTVIELPAGEHVLQLLLGDMNHIPHNPTVVSPPITVTVE